MQVRYEYRCDAAYFKAVIDRQYRQGPWLLRLPVQFGILGLICAAYTALTMQATTGTKIASFVGIFGLTVAFGIWGTKQGLMMKFRRKPGFGSRVVVTLSNAGIEVGADQSQTVLAWSTYPMAVRFADGILLKKQRSIRWLPDSAIVAGTAAEASGLIASNTMLRNIKESV